MGIRTVETFSLSQWPQQVAAAVAGEVQAAVEQRGVCHLALAGGTTPEPAYRALAETQLPWDAVEVWWGDERCVAPDDPESNYGMARRALLAHLHPAPKAVHPMDGTAAPERAAADYGAQLPPALDVVLLGVGSDGHTASLFPNGPQASPDQRVQAVQGPKPPAQRLTLTLATLNQARVVVFLVTGADKAPALRRILVEKANLPAAKVSPRERTRWLLDEAAASAL